MLVHMWTAAGTQERKVKPDGRAIAMKYPAFVDAADDRRLTKVPHPRKTLERRQNNGGFLWIVREGADP
jgi:hypothetical protein